MIANALQPQKVGNETSGSKLTEESHWKLGMDVSGIPGGWSSRKRQWWPEAGEQEAEEGRQGS